MKDNSKNKHRSNLKDAHGVELTRYSFDMYDNNDSYSDVKAVLDDVEGVGALIKDAVINYVRSPKFDLERYEGPGHRKNIK